jgi:sulfur relay (sulfurtransferase) complex TusBCD TusD component (DsrE family)
MLEVAQAAGHALDTLFLYHNGAYAALNRCSDPDDLRRWSHLALAGGLDCVVCRTAFARIDASAGAVPAAPFRSGGLPDWLLACERSDRVLRLGSLRAFSS